MSHYNSRKAGPDEAPPLPGNWRAVKRDGERGAVFACPKCTERGGLGPGTNHEISEEGKVTPSINCDCGWHKHLYLNDWSTQAMMDSPRD